MIEFGDSKTIMQALDASIEFEFLRINSALMVLSALGQVDYPANTRSRILQTMSTLHKVIDAIINEVTKAKDGASDD